MPAIRPCRLEEATALQDIERRAGERFREFGLNAVADDEPLSIEALGRYALDGRAWVAVDRADEPVGYVIVDVVDGNAHVEQVTVRPDHQGLGVGRALIDCVRAWAIQSGRRAITLTTFADVPWNRPLYEHIGFHVLADAEIGTELRALRAAETAHGLDPTIRVSMRLDLGVAPDPQAPPATPDAGAPRSNR